MYYVIILFFTKIPNIITFRSGAEQATAPTGLPRPMALAQGKLSCKSASCFSKRFFIFMPFHLEVI